MSTQLTVSVDGRDVAVRSGVTILEACDEAGIYIPRLCRMEGIRPQGSCRICTVLVDGRPQAACTQPVAAGMTIENDTAELRAMRCDLVDMLFVEGNHYCMVCERSGDCELQALAYRFGITAPRYPFSFPRRQLDASHPDLVLDRDRCVLCGRCVRASAQIDGKAALGFTGRGAGKSLIAAPGGGVGGRGLEAGDAAARACPTGALMARGGAYRTPVGRRRYDIHPIGHEIESARAGEMGR